MPIRAELRPLYPPDWPELSRRIRFERAGGTRPRFASSMRLAITQKPTQIFHHSIPETGRQGAASRPTPLRNRLPICWTEKPAKLRQSDLMHAGSWALGPAPRYTRV